MKKVIEINNRIEYFELPPPPGDILKRFVVKSNGRVSVFRSIENIIELAAAPGQTNSATANKYVL